MRVVYTKQEFPESWSFAVFLAGPTPRDVEVPSWRPEAIAWFDRISTEMGINEGLVLFIPEYPEGEEQWAEGEYTDQTEWEKAGLNFADVVMFWVPRDMTWMPAFTTNVEFGRWVGSGKAVLGHPEGAPKTRYLDWLAGEENVPMLLTLDGTCRAVLDKHPGHEVLTLRKKGERHVPLLVWTTPMFQDWYAAQVAVGNRLDEAQVRWVFHMPKLGKVFSWVLWVKVWIKAENRWKENEWVFARSDISTVVLWGHGPRPDPTKTGPLNNLLDASVVLIREFRSPVRNAAEFVYEVPGGSSAKDGEDPLQTASDEVHEETGLIIDADRFRALGSRQVAATLSSHHAHLYVAQLSAAEMAQAKALAAAGTSHGIEEDSEQTYVEVRSLREMLHTELVDWSMLGMVFKGLADIASR